MALITLSYHKTTCKLAGLAEALGVAAHELIQAKPADPWPTMRAQARQRLEAILERRDRDALAAVLPLLALAEESSARRMK